jgi:hypothetical protein
LYVATADNNDGTSRRSHIFKNLGQGVFEDVARGIVAGPAWNIAGYWGDYDNDGSCDLLGIGDYSSCWLAHNDGDCQFTDATPAMISMIEHSWGAAWVDYDADGWLDIFIARRDSVPKLLRNMNASSFEEVHSLPNPPLQSQGCAWADYDNDGDQDLYLVAEPAPNRLYRNDGHGEFTETTTPSLGNVQSGQGAAWGDYDNDGDLDLFITAWGDGSRLVRNDGAGEFSIVDLPALEAFYDAQSGVWGDYDLDGDLDLYVASNTRPNRLLRNDGNGEFDVVMANDPISDGEPSIAAAWADGDGDGDLDLYVTNVGSANRLFRNDIDHNGIHWLQVRLVGYSHDLGRSNRAAIGARVTLTAGNLIQVREIEGGSGYVSQNGLAAAFGLGGRTVIDQLTVRWPSGHVSQHEISGVDQLVVIEEPVPVAVEPDDHIPATVVLYQCRPNPFNPMTTISYDLPEATSVRLAVYDLSGRLVRTLRMGETESAGNHSITWNGLDDASRSVATGTYIYRIQAGAFTATKRMVLVK